MCFILTPVLDGAHFADLQRKASEGRVTKGMAGGTETFKEGLRASGKPPAQPGLFPGVTVGFLGGSPPKQSPG